MDREKALERVKNYSATDLLEWRKHVLFCLKWYQKDRNVFEIDECEFLIDAINRRLEELDSKR